MRLRCEWYLSPGSNVQTFSLQSRTKHSDEHLQVIELPFMDLDYARCGLMCQGESLFHWATIRKRTLRVRFDTVFGGTDM
jgi:hypothetical protein